MEQYPLWRVLFSRAEHYKSLSTDELDDHYYRDLYHHIQDCIRKIENKFEKGLDQQPKQGIIEISAEQDIEDVRVTDKHTFVVVGRVELGDEI